MATTRLEQTAKQSKFSLAASYCSLALSFLAFACLAGAAMAVLIATGLLEIGWDRLINAGVFSFAVAAILMIPGKWSPRGLYCRITKSFDAPNVNVRRQS